MNCIQIKQPTWNIRFSNCVRHTILKNDLWIVSFSFIYHTYIASKRQSYMFRFKFYFSRFLFIQTLSRLSWAVSIAPILSQVLSHTYSMGVVKRSSVFVNFDKLVGKHTSCSYTLAFHSLYWYSEFIENWLVVLISNIL